jgi:hypothetical protein
MEKLLPHYGRELNHLRRGLDEFAHRFPNAAKQLRIAGGESSDPGVQRVMRTKGASRCGLRTVHDVAHAPITVTARFMPRVDVPAA